MTRSPDALPPLLTADVDGGTFRLRRARQGDLPAIVDLLADAPMGARREGRDDLAPYERAFEAIVADPCHLLVVGEFVPAGSADGPVVATFQLSLLPGVSRRGAWSTN